MLTSQNKIMCCTLQLEGAAHAALETQWTEEWKQQGM